MRLGTLLLILALAACYSSRKQVSVEEEILRKYGGGAQQDVPASNSDIYAKLPDHLRFRLQVWEENQLKGANILSTLQMKKQTLGKIWWIRDQLELYRTPGGVQASELREKLLIDLEREAARLAIIDRHLPLAGLPADEQQKLDAWRRSALASADSMSLSEMRLSSARRIKWLEDQISELKFHHRDSVWDDYLRWSLDLRFEVLKLGHIERRLLGSG